MSSKQNLVGKVFSRLTVLEDISTKVRRCIWLCECSCGKRTCVTTNSLTRGTCKSCGCLRLEKLLERNRLLPGQSSRNLLLSSYKRNAKKRGFSWTLSKEDFIDLTQQPCWYCGKPPSQKCSSSSSLFSKKYPYVYNGLDRIDNTKGYERGNVLPCCGSCNIAKASRTQEEYLECCRQTVLLHLDTTYPSCYWCVV